MAGICKALMIGMCPEGNESSYMKISMVKIYI